MSVRAQVAVALRIRNGGTLPPLQWMVGAGVLVVAVAGFLRFMTGPAYYRRKPAEFLGDIAATLAGQPQGSILIMDHKGSDRFLQFRKPADTGRVEQAIVFGFPEVYTTKASWSRRRWPWNSKVNGIVP